MTENENICLNSELIAQYVAGDCSEYIRQITEEHIRQCEKCRERVKSAQLKIATYENHNSSDLRNGDTDELHHDIPAQGDVPTMESIPEPSATSSGTSFSTKDLEISFKGYHIVDELPRGGQAVVYKAIHKATKKKVALKVLLPGLLGSAKARRYFEQEVELAARLSHPNIVSIRDSGIAQGQYYFSMEYIHGQPLHRYVRSERLTFREKVVLFNKICDAMSHAHQNGVIHRDLKPSNILIDERGEPHILDFGLAKTATGLTATSESTDMMTITGQIKGTVAYMSPEQAAGRSDLVDVRTDVYSLGVILYEMFTGEIPYEVLGTVVEALENIQYAEPIRPRNIISKFDSDVEAILLKALEKDPSRRYQSAAELRHDTQCWLDGFPIMAKSISSLYLLRKVVARHRYTSTVVALLLLTILSFSYVSLFLLSRARKAERELEIIADQWKNVAEKMLTSYRQFGFMQFIEAWRDGRHKEATLMADLLSDGFKEKTGAMFLLNPKPLAEKEAAFRKEISDDYSWFADFVISEQHLKNGYNEEGIKACKRSYETIQNISENNLPLFDKLLIGQVKTRLYDLTTTESEDQTK